MILNIISGIVCLILCTFSVFEDDYAKACFFLILSLWNMYIAERSLFRDDS